MLIIIMTVIVMIVIKRNTDSNVDMYNNHDDSKIYICIYIYIVTIKT